MEEKIRNGYLYDFYGELLTDHQKRIYEDYVVNDLSLSEIAEDEGISRQAAHDLIRRCTKKLNEYENRLHLLQKFLAIRNRVEEIRTLTAYAEHGKERNLRDGGNEDSLDSANKKGRITDNEKIRILADEILEEL